ncbi:Trm112 family protein [Pararhizobium sp. IMCC21322]|uniref:Trm112 family protein n=1 Tax=Pararhizobium sp. IMCC21322 TaxID=3067903 RepID=UPI0027424328|nr:Trm112 family protein [Pararhizobium sp. IMCC21322]
MTQPDRKLLELLVCPVSRSPLVLDESGDWLLSKKARLKFPVRDGIPIMLLDEAEPLTD